MVQIPAPAQTRLYRGARSEQARSRSRSVSPLSSSQRRSDFRPQVYADATLVFPLLVAATFAKSDTQS